MKRIIMLAILLISGCVVPSDFKPPKLAIINVGMTSADVFSQQFRVRLNVENPNSVELPIKSIEYKLNLQGEDFADGTADQPFVVPAHGEAEFDTVVSTNFVSSIVKVLGTLNNSHDNKVQYTFTGKVHLSKGMVKKIPFSETGVVDLQNFRK